MANLKNKLAQKIEIIEDTHCLETPDTISSPLVPSVTANDTNLIVLKTKESNPSLSLVPDFAISLGDAKERIKLLQNFVKDMMIPGIDYGVIPKCDKPSLFKSGAEKLCDIFGFSKQIEILNRIEEWEKGLFHYEVKAILINKRSGLIEAEGIGCCNSKERKFRNQDSYSIINTLLKMAKKRALIDAVLSATRSSGIFTQDVEDLAVTRSSTLPMLATTNTIKETLTSSAQSRITKEQRAQIFLVAEQSQISIEDVKALMFAKYKLEETKLLTVHQADEFIDLLKCYNTI